MHDILINDNIFQTVKNNNFQSNDDYGVYLAIPVSAYKFELTGREIENNPIKTAVLKLRDYYNGSNYKPEDGPQKSMAERIAADLGLKKELVERVIQDEKEAERLEKQNGDETNVEDRQGTLKKAIFYALRENITGEYFYVVLEEDFDSMKKQVEDPRHYKIKLGDSKEHHIICLGSRNNGSVSELNRGPTETQVRKLLSKRSRKFKNEEIGSCGWPESFELVTSCYYPVNNAYTFCAINPFSLREDRWMTNFIHNLINNVEGKDIGRLKDVLEAIKPRREEKVPALKIEKELISDLEKFNKGVAAEVLGRVRKLIMSYAWLYRIEQKDSENIADAKKTVRELDVARQNFFIAIYTLIEDLLKISARNFRNEDDDKYLKAIDKLETEGNTGNFIKLLTELKFSSSKTTRSVRFKKNKMKDVYVKSGDDRAFDFEENSDNIFALIYFNLLEAKYNPEHPFCKIAEQYGEFIDTILGLRLCRNRAKHGNLSELGTTYYDCYHMIMDAFRIICGISEEEFESFPEPYSYSVEELQKEFDAAYQIAVQTLEKYSHLSSNPNGDIYEQALFECISFAGKDVEFFAKLSNLYDELLCQLIYGCVLSETVDTEIVNAYLKSQKSQGKTPGVLDGAIEILIHNGVFKNGSTFIAEDNGCDAYRNANKLLEENRKVELLSPRNKLLYYIYCLNRAKELKGKQPFNLKDFSGNLAELCLLVDKVERKRGHNKQAGFEKNGKECEEFHTTALRVCDILYQYI